MAVARRASPLRLLTERLSSTPPELLFSITPSLVALLVSSKDELQSAPQLGQKKSVHGADPSISLHRFKTQVSALLQSKQASIRWAAIVLVKAFVDVGGIDALQASAAWIRTIVGLIGQRFEHETVKKVSLIALAKFFSLTYGHPDLVREITTSSLQALIPYCLSTLGIRKGEEYRLKAGPKLTRIILQVLVLLLPRHPASFRPHRAELRMALSQTIAPSVSTGSASTTNKGSSTTRITSAVACRLLALLHHSAPKNGAANEWSRDVNTLLKHLERTADHVFRSQVETLAAPRANQSHLESVRDYKGPVKDHIADLFGLRPWHGIYEGSERLIACLSILEAFIGTTSPSALSIPISEIWALMERLLAVYGPFTGFNGNEILPRINPEAVRDEREGLWSQLPRIHEAALNVQLLLLRRLDTTGLSVVGLLLDQLAWTFEREQEHLSLRLTIYRVAEEAIALVGPALRKSTIESLRSILLAACNDAHWSHNPGGSHGEKGDGPDQGSGGTEHGRGKPTGSVTQRPVPLDYRSAHHSTALRLLYIVLREVQPSHINRSLRIRIDQTIILAQDRNGLLASVLNPIRQPIDGKITSSNLPFLARAYPQADAVEALVRPRLPIIRNTGAAGVEVETEDETEDEMDVERSHAKLRQDSSPAEVSLGDNELPLQSIYDTSRVAEAEEMQTTSPTAAVASYQDDTLLSPKRPRDHIDSPSRNTSTQASEPLAKRVKEYALESTLYDDRTTKAESGPVVNREHSIELNRNTQQVMMKSNGEEDFDVPQIHMPSDFEESDGEDSGDAHST